MAPPKTAFSFAMTAEGEALFLPVLKRFRNLYPRAYAKGAMSTNPLGLGGGELELGKRTHTVYAGFELFRGGVTPPPSELVYHRIH